MKQLLIAAFTLCIAGVANATPISLSQTQNITSSGQTLNFDFLGAPESDGSGGLFSFYAKGDFTDSAAPGEENASISMDLLGGSLVLNDGGVVSNSIAGLSLVSNSSTDLSGGSNNVLDFVFSLSGPLLDSLLADLAINVAVDLSSSVTYFPSYSPYMTLGFDYNDNSSSKVPEPGTLALLGLGLAGLGLSRKKKA